MMAHRSRIAIRIAGFVSTVLLAGCAAKPHDIPASAVQTGCSGDRPLEQRLTYIQGYLDKAFAEAPPLTEAEYQEVSRLGACAGGAVLGVGDGCSDQWALARASGLAERSRIRGAQYAVPRWIKMAQARPDRSGRIRNLTVALIITDGAHETNALRHAAAEMDDADYERTSTALNVVAGTLQDTIACESLR